MYTVPVAMPENSTTGMTAPASLLSVDRTERRLAGGEARLTAASFRHR